MVLSGSMPRASPLPGLLLGLAQGRSAPSDAGARCCLFLRSPVVAFVPNCVVCGAWGENRFAGGALSRLHPPTGQRSVVPRLTAVCVSSHRRPLRAA
eukprot:5681783-Alexandrium_andersonii.AAC.1